ncbi:hypothetical protein TNCV_818821 [Trichonephila clavipes]|nr:hypothetical protein TNCV_818821 [Trichonephila clavipes]
MIRAMKSCTVVYSSSKSVTSNPTPEIFSKHAPQSKKCWCSIVHAPHVLDRSGRHSLQQLREKWKIGIIAGFSNPTIALQIFAFVWPTPRLADCPLPTNLTN